MQKRPQNGFLSTLSLRRATEQSASYHEYMAISIHALLAESDPSLNIRLSGRYHFYPRSPCGERRAGNDAGRLRQNFYPRSPCGERLKQIRLNPAATPISIHALLAESDAVRSNVRAPRLDFYPRSPCGERRRPDQHRDAPPKFLSTLSLRRATRQSEPPLARIGFLSTLSLRRATDES